MSILKSRNINGVFCVFAIIMSITISYEIYGAKKKGKKGKKNKVKVETFKDFYKTENDTKEDVFLVKEGAKVKNANGFGVNMKHSTLYSSTREPFFNIYNPCFSMEPTIILANIYIDEPTGCTETILKRTDNHGLSSKGKFFNGGHIDGSVIRHYTKQNDAYVLVHTTKVKSYVGRKNPEDKAMEWKEVLELVEPGPMPKAGDVFQVETFADIFPWTKHAGKKRHIKMLASFVTEYDENGKRVFSIDMKEKCSEAGSTASFRLDINGGNLHCIRSTIGGKYPPVGTDMGSSAFCDIH